MLKNTAQLNKALQKCSNGFYTVERILSYNKPLNIITGPRSTGKSTGTAIFSLLYYIYIGGGFLYTRRTKDETDLTKGAFFNDAIDIINEAKLGFKIVYFSCKGKEYYITINYDNESYNTKKYNSKGEVVDESPEEEAERIEKETQERAKCCGRSLALSMVGKAKSGFDFRGIDNIIFDEFVAEEQTDYLGSSDNPYVEYTKLISLYVTCDRKKGSAYRNETRMFLLGNLANVYNPILLKLKANTYLVNNDNAKFISPKNEAWVIQQAIPSDAAQKKIKESYAYQLMDKSEQDYNFKNQTRSGYTSKKYIKREMPKGCMYVSGFILGGTKHGIYRDNNYNLYINKYQTGKNAEALDIVSYSAGDTALLVQNWRNSPYLNLIYKAFIRHKLFFDNQKTQHDLLMYLEFIPH